MGRRTSVHVVKRDEAQSKESPNATFPEVTVDLRVFWPRDAGNLAATLALLDHAYYEARNSVIARESGIE